ncbi:efflux transporter outer membrane subunit [Zymobacter sp. IVIA_12111.31 C1]|uniref:efflux transporter outer membrane subunit n=1 Tax=Zymobacter sp. IVIA_12111.31 C1 TaxID=3394854 RepID=UPI0039C16DAC
MSFHRMCSALLTVPLVMAGCVTVGPDFKAPSTTAPTDWQARPATAPALSRSLAVSDAALPQAWWQVFNDPTLDALQERALRASPDLCTALLRFAESRQQRAIAASQAAPDVSMRAQASRQRLYTDQKARQRIGEALGNGSTELDVLDDPFSLYQGGFDMSWELDLWGRVRRSIESADASIQAAGAEWRNAQLMLSSELARAYFELRQLQRQHALLNRNIALNQTLLDLQQAQARNGVTNDDPVLAQAQQRDELQGQEVALQAQQAALINQIGRLTGDQPGALNTLLAPLPTTDATPVSPILPTLALGNPADLLRRRPDVQAAEARLHAATAEIGVATADLYPRITLGASASYQTLDSRSLGSWDSHLWQVGPSLSLPIFDRGRRRATVELKRMDQQVAAVAWQQAVLNAWQEVDDALNDQAAERQRNQYLRTREAASREQLTFARTRAANGLVSGIDVLQAELRWRQTQDALVQSDSRLETSLVRLFKAVRGGVSEEGRSATEPSVR